jgi:hypothetical protein
LGCAPLHLFLYIFDLSKKMKKMKKKKKWRNCMLFE